jgi:hypothetical protein
MAFDSVLPQNHLPEQNIELILLLAGWYNRALLAHQPWAEQAKKCVEYLEGQQISETDRQIMNEQGRPILTINKIAPLVRLVMGYYRNNKVDEKALPGHDGSGVEETAQAITHLFKQISENSQQPYVDAEVFGEGISTGRAYWDTRLDFEENDFGECKVGNSDPFATLLDPDGTHYDVNKSNYIITQSWQSLEQIGAKFGPEAVKMAGTWLTGGGYSGMPQSFLSGDQDTTPWRSFGGETDLDAGYSQMLEYAANVVDPVKRAIRTIDFQYYQPVRRGYFVDMETGYKHPIPDHWGDEKVQKAKAFWDFQFQSRGRVSPLEIDYRPGQKLRWTVLVGDIMVFDKWSIYETFTKTAYFPYFRRGKTRGMIEDLLDPQDEVNKRRSAFVDILTRTANGGWMINEDGMDDEEIERLEDFGAAPGFVGRWRGENHMKPDQINTNAPPRAMERAEQKGSEDLNDISGINRDALGAMDKVQSGRAIEAKQRQAVIALQVYMDNMSRSKELHARKKLEIIQSHYTEQRTVRILGENGNPVETIINQRAAGMIANNVTMGRYQLVIDETPLAASFISAQFDDLLALVEKGILPKEAIMDIAVDLSSLPQKEIIKQRVNAILMSMGMPTADQLMAMQANGGGVPGAPGMPMPGRPGGPEGPGAPGGGGGGPPVGGVTNVQPTGSITDGNVIPINAGA